VLEQAHNRVGLAATLVVLAFLHFALAPLLDSWYLSPNLLVCAVLIAGRELRPGAAAAVGFVLGLLEDSMAVSYFGLATILLTLIGFVGSLTRDLFLGEERLFMGTYLFFGTWVYEAASYLLMGAAGDPLAYLLLRAPLDALATGIVGYLTVPIWRAR
jgi:rod shape-determining protein MreD